MIPFSVTIPPQERDRDLFEKLKPEWPGILKWMLAGCFSWQERGLAPPRAVTEATDAYLTEEDALAMWIEECCITNNRNNWEASAVLWRSWKAWAERRNESVGSQKSLGQALDEIGYHAARSQDARGHQGIKLKPHPEERERADWR